MFRLGFFALILPLSLFASVYQEEGPCPNGKPHYRVGLRHIESGGIGYKKGYTTLEAFLSSDPSQWSVTPFLDVKGHVFDNGKWAANAGIGLRTLWGSRVYGINTYYDYRNASHFHSNQIGVGLETLGQLFDLRLNGYLPIGAKTSTPYDSVFKAFSGNYLLIAQKYLSAMKGADAEFGFHFGKTKLFDFYAAAGPYYFIGKKDPATWGGKARLSGTFKEVLSLEISDSYDKTFHNKFQGKLSLSFPLGPKSKIKAQGSTCKVANTLNNRMLQPIDRQEIIVIDKTKKTTPAIDPATGLPYFFVFVSNTSSSNGTYESPYHSLAQAQDNSSPHNIIYVFPGDGTTTGMDSGIFLKANQKFWGSGIDHSLQTSQGTISIPAQSSSSPTITNIDTEGNAITLATNNVISGVTITSTNRDAIYGTDPQSLEVSFCTIETTTRFAIEASFSDDASISLTNNQFLNNTNGVFLTLNGPSTLVCSDNTFTGQSSDSDIPLSILANNNILQAHIENNLFDDNIIGSVVFNLQNVVNADIILLNNIITNNGAGSRSSLGSSFVIFPGGTSDHCSVTLEGNTFSNNTESAVYLDAAGEITTLEITASTNTFSDNGGSALFLKTPATTLTLLATDNIIMGGNSSEILLANDRPIPHGTITINNNTITGGASNGIDIGHGFSTLNLTILNNEINSCGGTGIVSYAATGITSLTLSVSGNTISNCENLSSNAASGIDIEQYRTLVGSVTNNTLSDNAGLNVMIGSTLPTPTACLTLTGNSSANYFLSNPDGGLFNLSPCDVASVNAGTINTSGDITPVQSCPDATPCPP